MTIVERTLLSSVNQLIENSEPVGRLDEFSSAEALLIKISQVTEGKFKEHLIVAERKLIGSGCPICEIPTAAINEINWKAINDKLEGKESPMIHVADATRYFVKESLSFKTALKIPLTIQVENGPNGSILLDGNGVQLFGGANFQVTTKRIIVMPK